MHRRTAIGVIAGASLATLTGGATSGVDTETTTAVGEQPDTERGDPNTATRLADAPPDTGVDFEVGPVSLTECGITCRDATTTLTNTGSRDATGVRAAVSVFTDDTLVWETDDHVGRLAAGNAVTRTHRIDVDPGTALAIRENDGRIRMEVTIVSDQQTERVVREKDAEV
ncbi:hypothetical protein [Natronococcus wangiae]|uniref:hypothetical protein n=1 Tax=Natronococcus wangiae TaxID=3068275 RepID=UPI0027401377|nr:hypothetical protein [Natronococcus sp. AD5]